MKKKKTASEQRMILANNIRGLLEAKGKTQTDMARDLEIAETTVSSWLNCERYPRIDKIQQLADYFGVYRSDITDDKKSKRVITSSQYPFLSAKISAGLPVDVEAITHTDTISLPDTIMGKWAGQSDISIMRVNGESMNKTIPDQSLIAVKPTALENLKDGDIVVYSDNHDYSVKRMFKQEDRIIFRPHSTDIRFTDYIVSTDNENLKIYGKVVVYIVEMD